MTNLQLKVRRNPGGLDRGDVRSDYFNVRMVVGKIAGSMLA